MEQESNLIERRFLACCLATRGSKCSVGNGFQASSTGTYVVASNRMSGIGGGGEGGCCVSKSDEDLCSEAAPLLLAGSTMEAWNYSNGVHHPRLLRSATRRGTSLTTFTMTPSYLERLLATRPEKKCANTLRQHGILSPSLHHSEDPWVCD